jgi:hypothetical protein
VGHPDGRLRRVDRRALGGRTDARPRAAADREDARGEPLPRPPDADAPPGRDRDASRQLLLRRPLAGRVDALRDRARQPARRRRVPGACIRHRARPPAPLSDPRPPLGPGGDVRVSGQPGGEPGRPLGLHPLPGEPPLVRPRARHGRKDGRLRRSARGHPARAGLRRPPRRRPGRRDACDRLADGRNDRGHRHEDALARDRARRGAHRSGGAGANARAGRGAGGRPPIASVGAPRRRDRARRGRVRRAAPAPAA